nr:MAG TPA: hypothetical protein [Caudoviricetes sp.]
MTTGGHPPPDTAQPLICSAAQLTGRSFYGSSTLRNADR